jgi:hypothetical protein
MGFMAHIRQIFYAAHSKNTYTCLPVNSQGQVLPLTGLPVPYLPATKQYLIAC